MPQVRVGLATKPERASRQQRTYRPSLPNQRCPITNSPNRQAAQEPPEDPPWYRQGKGCQGQEGEINDELIGRIHTTRHHDWALMDMALYLQSAWKFGLMAWVAEQNGCNETFSCDALRGSLVPKGDRCSLNMLANTNTKKIRTKRPRDPISNVLICRQLRVSRLPIEPRWPDHFQRWEEQAMRLTAPFLATFATAGI
jgi:hypothetical protein